MLGGSAPVEILETLRARGFVIQDAEAGASWLRPLAPIATCDRSWSNASQVEVLEVFAHWIKTRLPSWRRRRIDATWHFARLLHPNLLLATDILPASHPDLPAVACLLVQTQSLPRVEAI